MGVSWGTWGCRSDCSGRSGGGGARKERMDGVKNKAGGSPIYANLAGSSSVSFADVPKGQSLDLKRMQCFHVFIQRMCGTDRTAGVVKYNESHGSENENRRCMKEVCKLRNVDPTELESECI